MERDSTDIKNIDSRRRLVVLPDASSCYLYTRDLFFHLAKKSIAEKGIFTAAIPGGTTPKKLFPLFEEKKNLINWEKVYIFFTDERMVDIDDPESNAGAAWNSFFSSVLPKNNFFPMVLSRDASEESARYETLLQKPLDFILLGMGEDGHVASLFPDTSALKEENKRVVENFVPEKNLTRITLTYRAIHEANFTALLVLGEKKSPIVREILFEEKKLPAFYVGTEIHPALWIVDTKL